MANVKELNINSTTYDIIGKGIVDQNNTSTPLKQWSGTKAQYDAIVTKDANTIYNITDDTNPNDYAHTNLDNVSAGIDFVVASQLPTSSNNYTWYRLYKSGWVEQGGVYTNMSASSQTVNLLVEMADTNYTVENVLEQINAYAGNSWAIQDCPNVVQSKTVSSFSRVMPSSASRLVWEVKGMSAQGGS